MDMSVSKTLSSMLEEFDGCYLDLLGFHGFQGLEVWKPVAACQPLGWPSPVPKGNLAGSNPDPGGMEAWRLGGSEAWRLAGLLA